MSSPPSLQCQLSLNSPILGDRIGRGGEGNIYAVVGQPSWVAKLYHPDKLTSDRVSKLRLMVDRPLHNAAIAAPFDLLCDSHGRVLGFLMPRVPDGYPLHDLYTPRSRRRKLPFFTYTHLHRVARNLAIAVASLHHHDYVIGDVNESNVLVNTSALVFLIDTDSFQICDRHQNPIYRCGVGKPEFTPPELQGRRFEDCDRTPDCDNFGLAVLIFQLLMEGTHPFDGVYLDSGEPPLIQHRIASGYFPHGTRSVPLRPKPIAPPLDLLHPKIQQLFQKCFEAGHDRPHLRPSAATWAFTLETAEAELRLCPKNPRHTYPGHLAACPWCDRARKLGGRDPFPAPNAVIPPIPQRRSRATPKRPRRIELPPTPTRPRHFARPRQPFRRTTRPWWLMLGGCAATVAACASFGYWQVRSSRETALTEIQTLATAGKYDACVWNAQQVSASLRSRAQPIADRCHLGEARRLADGGDLEGALAQLRQISADSNAIGTARRLRDRLSEQLIDRARDLYDSGEFDRAIATLNSLPASQNDRRDELVQQWQAQRSRNRDRFEAAKAELAANRPHTAIAATRGLATPYWRDRGAQLRDEARWELFERALAGDRLDDAAAWIAQMEDDKQRDRARQQLRIRRERRTRESNRDRLDLAQSALYRGDFDRAQMYLDVLKDGNSDGTGGDRVARLTLETAIADYRQLAQQLAAGNWERASLWTRQQLQRFASDRLPCRDVQLLDRLWQQYSGGEHGLSVQLQYKRSAGIFGETTLTPKQRETLDRVYPQRFAFGQTGGALDEALAICLTTGATDREGGDRG